MKEHIAEIAVQSTNFIEPLEAIAALVGTLLESFSSATDLYHKLRRKTKKSEERNAIFHRGPLRRHRDSSSDSDALPGHEALIHRRRSASRSRRSGEYSDSDEESIAESSAAIRAEYDYGYDHLGEEFAMGDLLAQNQLQAQVITLQRTIIRLYQLNESHVSTGDLRRLVQTTRSARIAAKDALATLYQRLRHHEIPRIPGAFPQSVFDSQNDRDVVLRPKSSQRWNQRDSSRDRGCDTDTAPQPYKDSLFCPYAVDLQNDDTQPLADSLRAGGDGRCPCCSHLILESNSKAWEIVLEDDNPYGRSKQRAFLVMARFVAKCHREGGGFACVLCSRYKESDTVCNEIRELIDHIWREHNVGDVLGDEDIREIAHK